jgi:dihydrofolate synthase/folylpolyglutamate synthase
MNAAAYLDSLIHLGVKFGLENTRALCAALGHPELRYPTLLVAGTNGKGSVAAYLDQALRASGLRVGRYTSPHLVRVNERIVVDGREATDTELSADLQDVRDAAAVPPTYFEALTAAGFLRFGKAAVDVAVLEVGMGGRLDATNVAEPLVSAIVSIAFDHEAYLGSTLAAIAGEKAGVLRPRRTTVLGPLPPEARRAVQTVADAGGARLVDATIGASWSRSGAAIDLVTPAATYTNLRPLAGAHQVENLLVAVRVLEEARATGLPLDLERAAAGLTRETTWPGRLQWLPGPVPFLLDGAHNAAGAAALARHLETLGPFVLLFGALQDKAFPEMARLLFPLAREVVVTTPPSERAAAPADVVAAVGDGERFHVVEDLDDALRLAEDRARGLGPVVVAGSLYLVGAVLERRWRDQR